MRKWKHFYPDASGFSYDKVAFDAKGASMRAWFNRGRAAQSYRWLPGAYAERLADNCRNLRMAGGGAVWDCLSTCLAPGRALTVTVGAVAFTVRETRRRPGRELLTTCAGI